MTVSTTATKVSAPTNGSATIYSYSPLVLFADTELEVTLVLDSSGAETVIPKGTGSAAYAIVVTGDYPQTGSIRYPEDEVTPQPSGYTIVMKRVLAILQPTDLAKQGGYFADTQENQFDRLVMIDLQQQDLIDRSLKIPVSSSGISTDLPVPVGDQFLKWNTAGDAITSAATTTGIAVASSLTPVDSNIAGGVIGIGTDYARDDHEHQIPAGSDAVRGFLGVLKDVFTTRGDTIRQGASAEERLALGSSEEVLVSDGTDVVWGRGAFNAQHIEGLVQSPDAVPDDDTNITAGSCRDGGDTANMVLATEITKGIDGAWVVGDDAGGLDTGSVAADTWYALWLIERPDTGVVDALYSLSFSAPTMPTNYTLKRLIGVVLTDATSDILPYSVVETAGGGLRYLWDDPPEDIAATNPGTSAVLATLSSPPRKVEVHLNIFVKNSTGPAGFTYVSSPDANDEVATVTGGPLSTTIHEGSSSARIAAVLRILTNASSQVRYRTTVSDANTEVHIATLGWEDYRRVA